MQRCHLENKSIGNAVPIIKLLYVAAHWPIQLHPCLSVPRHLDTKRLIFSVTEAFYSGLVTAAITELSNDKVSYYPARLQLGM